MTEERNTKRAATRKCPVCGHEAWRVIYGMVMPDVMEQYPKAEFPGCVVMEEQRLYPATGHVEWGRAEVGLSKPRVPPPLVVTAPGFYNTPSGVACGD